MKLFAALALSSMCLATACVDGDGGEGSTKSFVGSYRNTLTVSGSGSQTLTDGVTISEGSSSDLVIKSETLGALEATIIGNTSFSIDQQQILLNIDGQAVSVTAQGQGTVADGVFNANGTLSTSQGSLSFTWAGSRL